MKYKRKPIIFSFCEIFRDWKTVDQDIVEMIKEKIPIMLQNNNVACENYTVIFTPDFVYNDSDASIEHPISMKFFVFAEGNTGVLLIGIPTRDPSCIRELGKRIKEAIERIDDCADSTV